MYVNIKSKQVIDQTLFEVENGVTMTPKRCFNFIHVNFYLVLYFETLTYQHSFRGRFSAVLKAYPGS